MSKFEEGMQILNEKFGKGKDNVISLATIALEEGASGNPRPALRDIDAYYEDGVFYAVTYAQSNKMKEIKKNPEVSVSVHFEDFFSSGTGVNLGWVLAPENAQLRTKLREVFKEWYDFANNEQDENCCFLAVHMKKGILRINHGEAFYHFDFENKSAT
ncbi:MAG: pyridoxamine 5'-phosphate oxidase family protein [Clostridiales bacterium]|nr:pyridoxamine 5'-phosphate oxidase family protein [Clostridiales bacterium]